MRKKIMSLVMDSRGWMNQNRRGQKHRRAVTQAGRPADVASNLEERLRAGGFGYGDLKKALFEHYWNYFADARKKRADLAANLDYVNPCCTMAPSVRGKSRLPF
jgi:tryptophanyl-tRNA synthetase